MKRLLILLLAAAAVLSLTGCAGLLESDSLLRPPKASYYEQEICDAINLAVGRQPLLRYPRSGDHRSAITMKDLNSDGFEEAVAFYCLSADSPVTSVAVVANTSGGWQVIGSAEGPGGGVDTLYFGNLTQSESLELVVGWSVASGRGLLSVYSVDNGLTAIPVEDEAGSEQQSASGYTGFSVFDADSDGADEILTATLSTVNRTSTARMLKYLPADNKLYVAGTCALDGSVGRYSSVVGARLDDTARALIIDSYKTADTMTTEAVCWDRTTGTLIAPLNAPDGTVSATDRIALTTSRDIDGDGVIEFPSHELLPCYTESSAEKYYRTSWYSYDPITGRLSENSKVDTIINLTDGYYLTLPSSWPDDLTVHYDSTYNTLTFCREVSIPVQLTVSCSDLTGAEEVISCDEESDTALIASTITSFGSELLRIRVFDAVDADKMTSYGYQPIYEQGAMIWAAFITGSDEEITISYNIINTCFALL